MTSSQNRSWTIKTSSDLLEKAKRELARFRKSHEEGDGQQVDHALNCAITLWHMHDWLWREDKAKLSSAEIKDKRAFQEWLKRRPKGDLLGLCERIANGTKHLHLDKRADIDLTTYVSAKDRPDSMERAIRARLESGEKYVVWSLNVEDARDVLKLTDTRGNYIGADRLFDEVVGFWEQLIGELRNKSERLP